MENGWFHERSPMWPGQAMSLEIKEVLLDMKSEFQHIVVFESVSYGRVLVLDGAIQTTDRDEFAYQEMISLLPINSHESPKKILIIGGGDGGVLRECVRHPGVESVTLCEIDKEVIAASRKFLPNLSCSFDDPKVTLHFGDGCEFMRQHQNEFDVIITDSSDPIGPAETLFQEEYFVLMKKALRENGVLCTQGECIWLHLDLIEKMLNFCGKHFETVDYGYCTIPTYPSGQIGFVLCSVSPTHNFRTPHPQSKLTQCDSLRYYSNAVHASAFVLPKFAEDRLSLNRKKSE